MKFKGCKNLIFDTNIICNSKLMPLRDNMGMYWERNEATLLPGARKEVQQCKLRGRIYGKVSCLKGMAECGEYEEVEHNIEILEK